MRLSEFIPEIWYAYFAPSGVYDETGRQVTAAALVTLLDVQHYQELGLSVPLVAVVATTDAQHYQDLGLIVPITAVLQETDRGHYVEAPTITAQGQLLLTELQHYKDQGLAVSIQALVDIVETFHGNNPAENLSFVVVSSVNVADFAHRVEVGLPVDVQAAVALGSELYHPAEVLAATLAATLTAQDEQSYRDTLALIAVGVVDAIEAQHYLELGLYAGLQALVSVTDEIRQARPGVPLFAFSTPAWARSFITPEWGFEVGISGGELVLEDGSGFIVLEDLSGGIAVESGVAFARSRRGFVTPRWARRFAS